MSLKVFHIFFVVVSTLLMAAFAAWSLREYTRHHDGADLALGGVGILGAAALLVYGRWFWRKLKNMRLA